MKYLKLGMGLLATTLLLACSHTNKNTAHYDAASFSEPRHPASEGSELGAAQAANQIMLLAQSGHAPSQYILGRLYFYGTGVEQNQQLALKWFDKAAEQDARAQYSAGFLRVVGAISKYIISPEWRALEVRLLKPYQKLEADKHPVQFTQALETILKIIMQELKPKVMPGIALIQKAALRKDPQATLVLDTLKCTGWVQGAASQELPVSSRLSPALSQSVLAQRAQLQEVLNHLAPLSHRLQSPSLCLSFMAFPIGIQTPPIGMPATKPNPSISKWVANRLEKLIKQQNSRAMFLMSTLHDGPYASKLTKQQKSRAFNLLVQSAQRNDVRAQEHLSRTWYSRNNLTQAYYWAERAAHQGSTEAMDLLIRWLMTDRGLPINLKKFLGEKRPITRQQALEIYRIAQKSLSFQSDASNRMLWPKAYHYFSAFAIDIDGSLSPRTMVPTPYAPHSERVQQLAQKLTYYIQKNIRKRAENDMKYYL